MEHNKNQLIPINNSLANFERQIAIGEKLLGIILSDSEKNLIKQFLIETVTNNYDIAHIISIHFPWTEELIEKYKAKLNWTGLCGNKDVIWNEELIDKYFEFINWESLSVNYNIEWNEKLLNKYSNHLNFNSVFFSEHDGSLQLTPILLKKFIDKIDFKELSIDYELLPKEFIKKNVEALDWKNLESYTIENLEIFQHKIDWDDLSQNRNLILTDELIERFKYRWSWDEIIKIERKNGIPTFIRLFETRYSDGIYTNIYYDAGNVIDEEFLNALIDHSVWYHLSRDTNFNNNYSLLQKFENKWDWTLLTFNSSIKWSFDLIEKFKNKIDWEVFSLNPSLQWTLELIEKYIDKWDWKILGMNSYLPWSLDFYKKYEHKFHLEFLFFHKEFTSNSNNYFESNNMLSWYFVNHHFQQNMPRVIFDENLISYIKGILDWNLFSRYYEWSLTEIEKSKESINWEALSKNRIIIWSVELLKRYEEKWDWDGISWNKCVVNFDLSLLTTYIHYLKENNQISSYHAFIKIRNLFLKYIDENDVIEILEKYHKADTN